MLSIVGGIVIVLHGIVHLLYAGHGARMFELQPGLAWPDGAWTRSWLPSGNYSRLFATGACLVASVGFVLGGAGLVFGQDWWRWLTVAAAILSSAVWLLFWDGGRSRLAEQGVIGLALNVVVLAAAGLSG